MIPVDQDGFLPEFAWSEPAACSGAIKSQEWAQKIWRAAANGYKIFQNASTSNGLCVLATSFRWVISTSILPLYLHVQGSTINAGSMARSWRHFFPLPVRPVRRRYEPVSIEK